LAYLGNRRLLCKDLGSFGVVGVSQRFDWSCFDAAGGHDDLALVLMHWPAPLQIAQHTRGRFGRRS
jgi:hypothetical protein